MSNFLGLLVYISIFISLLFLMFKLYFKLPLDLQKLLLDFWSYKEMRVMVMTCLVLFFASLIFPMENFIRVHNEIKTPNKIEFELSGKSYSPVSVEVKNK